MRELVYYVATSADGFIAGPGGDVSAFPTQGDHIDWITREYTDTLPDVALTALGLTADGSQFDTTLMGWDTYAAGFAFTRDPYPHTRQIVFSRSRTTSDAGGAVEVTSDDPVSVVRALKAQEGSGIWLCGGGALAATLVDEIDRFVLKVNPVLLGSGIPLLGGVPTTALPLELVASRRFDSGVVVNEHVRRELAS